MHALLDLFGYATPARAQRRYLPKGPSRVERGTQLCRAGNRMASRTGRPLSSTTRALASSSRHLFHGYVL
jgi:hypothetical protein